MRKGKERNFFLLQAFLNFHPVLHTLLHSNASTFVFFLFFFPPHMVNRRHSEITAALLTLDHWRKQTMSSYSTQTSSQMPRSSITVGDLCGNTDVILDVFAGNSLCHWMHKHARILLIDNFLYKLNHNFHYSLSIFTLRSFKSDSHISNVQHVPIT